MSLTLIANASEKVNGKCRVAGQTISVKGKDLSCVKKGKKLRWTALPKKKMTPSTATSSPTSSVVPSPTPSPTPTKVRTIAERWNEVDPTALNVARPLIETVASTKHSVNFFWKTSDKANPEVLNEIKRRYEAAAKYWESHVRVSNPLLVLVGNMGEIEWLCREKLSWLGWNQPDCVEVESAGDWSNGTAGQSQAKTRNVDMYTLDTLDRLNTVGWLARIEHEFVHNVFHAINPEYNRTMPCWMIESGAEYWGIVTAVRGDSNRFIQLRNHQAQTRPDSMRGASEQVWFEFINRTDRTQLDRPAGGDPCGPVRTEVYSHAILANEFLAGKVGLKGYLELVRLAGTQGWSSAIQGTFSRSREELYREMAAYMKTQFDLVQSNTWSLVGLPNR